MLVTSQPFPTFKTETLLLTEILDSDQSAIFSLFSSPEVMAFYDMEPLVDEQEAKEMTAFLQSFYKRGIGLRWALRENQTGSLIGTCGFNNWNSIDQTIVIGYDLMPEHWGKGYATEIVATLLKLAFSGQLPYSINRIEASVVPGNIGSEQVLKKNGFQLEGVLREKGFWSNQHHDMQLFALLKRDYSEHI